VKNPRGSRRNELNKGGTSEACLLSAVKWFAHPFCLLVYTPMFCLYLLLIATKDVSSSEEIDAAQGRMGLRAMDLQIIFSA
jgi:hypothetical protein